MSPFAGSTRDLAWRDTDLSAFLDDQQDHTSIQVAFRLAYDLPQVARVVVGTTNPTHLAELTAATRLRISPDTIPRYRQLIAARP